jgi:DNA-binding beta-propeller fold protein YncE
MADGQLRTLTIAGANTAPVAGTPTISTPNASTGAVTVALNFTDPDGDTLTYTTTQPATGTVTITGPGVYTFTPTQAARDAATTPQGVHSTTFTITASDGKAATTVPVTVAIAPAANSDGVFALGSVTMTGQRPGSLVVTADGTRALLVTGWPIGPVTQQSYPNGTGGSTTRVAVIDTTSGNQIGTTFTFTGPQPIAPVLSADGTRAYIVSTGAGTGSVTEINTTTGTQIGTTLTLTGGSSSSLVLSPDGTRALVTTGAYSAATNTTTTRVAVLNTSTGTQTGTILTLNGVSVYGPTFSPDGSRVLITTDVVTTVDNVAVINTVTGTQTGTTLTVNGALLYAPTLSPDGSRAVITARDYTADTTGMTVFNMTTGTQIGTTLTLAGYGSVQFVGNGSRAVITSTAGTTTRVAVFDTSAGTQIGTTLTLTGDTAMETSPDGTRVLLTTDVYDSATSSHTTRLTMVSTTTGTQTGTLSLTGSRYNNQPVFSPDGTRALITTTVYNSATTLHTSRVTMFDTATGTQIGTTLTLTGPEVATTTWRADGNRALITMIPTQYDSVTSPTLVAVVDTNGTQIGTTLTLPGMPIYGARPVWSPDGTLALISTKVYNNGGGVIATVLTTVDTTTGAQAGTPITLTSGTRTLTPDGMRAVIIDGNQVSVFNATTGAQLGSTVTLDGAPSSSVFNTDGSRLVFTSASSVTVLDTTTGIKIGTTPIPASLRSTLTLLTLDGTHALVTTDYRGFGYPGIPTTPVAVIDLTTGTQTGSTLTLTGDTYASPAFTPDGTRALITTSIDDAATGVSTTRVTTINTATGRPIGTTVTLTGPLASGITNPLRVVLSPDGTRALVATSPNTGGRTSQAAIIDTATGTQIGSTVTINGAVSGLKWSPDGTRVFVTTYITTATGADMNVAVTVLETF